MKALVKFADAPDMAELREVPEPDYGPSEALLEVKAAGVCGSDVLMYKHVITHARVPVILGHEFTGTLAAVGSEVVGFKPGDRVVSETAGYVCGRCLFCRSGQYNLCPERKGYGYGTNGAFTRFVRVRPTILHPLPDQLSFEEAALIEPLCVAYNALVEKSRIRPGDTVAVIGPGAIGLLCVQVARLAGAGTVILVGKARHQERLALGQKLGADVVLASDELDPAAYLQGVGDGYGAHLVVECTGVGEAMRQAVAMVRRNGQITRIGLGPVEGGFNVDRLVEKAATLTGSYSHTFPTWERAVQLVASGRVQTRPLIGGVYPLSRWKAAFDDADAGRVIKAVLVPDAE